MFSLSSGSKKGFINPKLKEFQTGSQMRKEKAHQNKKQEEEVVVQVPNSPTEPQPIR